MAPAEADEEGAKSATTYYAVMGTAADAYAWVALKPITGRTRASANADAAPGIIPLSV